MPLRIKQGLQLFRKWTIPSIRTICVVHLEIVVIIFSHLLRTRESLTWCNFYFKSFKNFPGYTAYDINCVLSVMYSGCLGDRCFGTQTLALKKHFSCFFLGPRHTKGPIKSPLSVCLSVRPSVRRFCQKLFNSFFWFLARW